MQSKFQVRLHLLIRDHVTYSFQSGIASMIFQETYKFPTFQSMIEWGIGIVRLRGILHIKFPVLRDSKSYSHHSSTTPSVM
jgi:hypothetical protein